jgi:hypothetical protein
MSTSLRSGKRLSLSAREATLKPTTGRSSNPSSRWMISSRQSLSRCEILGSSTIPSSCTPRDNGFLFGQHGLSGKNSPYEGSIRVPLVIRGPGVPENQRRSQLVNNLDIVATIEDLAGTKPGPSCDGHTLAPLFAMPNFGGAARSSSRPATTVAALRKPTPLFVRPTRNMSGTRPALRNSTISLPTLCAREQVARREIFRRPRPAA